MKLFSFHFEMKKRCEIVVRCEGFTQIHFSCVLCGSFCYFISEMVLYTFKNIEGQKPTFVRSHLIKTFSSTRKMIKLNVFL